MFKHTKKQIKKRRRKNIKKQEFSAYMWPFLLQSSEHKPKVYVGKSKPGTTCVFCLALYIVIEPRHVISNNVAI